MAAGTAQLDRLALRARMMARTLSPTIRRADDAEQQHVGEADREVELAERAQHA